MKPSPNATSRVQDLEVKDPQLIFNRIWSGLEQEFGLEHLRFPKEIFWLNGSPGAGKGTNTRFIMKLRDVVAPPITVSDLLKSEDARKRKDAGLLVGDREVTELVFRRLLDPQYDHGAIVDGYPRTKVQVECLKYLYAKMQQLHYDSAIDEEAAKFRKTRFHIIVLFIDEKESIRRQLLRGKQIEAHNSKVRESGEGEIQEVRKTDLNEEAAYNRYRVFKEVTYEALKSLREVFHYHFIDAQGSIPEVQDRIVRELSYQSSLELDEDTFRLLADIPVASQMSLHARQELVRRLENYQRDHSRLFAEVVSRIREVFIPEIRRHGISGMAFVNVEDPLFSKPEAIAILIDVFSERGYHAVVDFHRDLVPDRIDLQTGKIHLKERPIHRIRVHFGGSEIRRGR